LLKIKAQPQFDRAVDRTVEGFFAFFSGRIWPNFSLLFPFLLFGRQRVASFKKPRGAPASS
jgi:hypothetical protein